MKSGRRELKEISEERGAESWRSGGNREMGRERGGCDRVRWPWPHEAPAAPAPDGVHRPLSTPSAFSPLATRPSMCDMRGWERGAAAQPIGSHSTTASTPFRVQDQKTATSGHRFGGIRGTRMLEWGSGADSPLASANS